MLTTIGFYGQDSSRVLMNYTFDVLAHFLDVLTVTDCVREARRFSDSHKGMLLLMTELAAGKQKEDALDLVDAFYQKHRDAYIVAMLPTLQDLNLLLEHAVKLSGILLPPFSQEQTLDTIKRVVKDYRTQIADATNDDSIIVRSGTTTVRLPKDTVLYVEAQSKRLDIWTKRQAISVYQSMDSIQHQLGEGFLRIHRSYLVNVRAVSEVDTAEMLLTLFGGIRLPISRANKAAVRMLLENKIPEVQL